MRHLGDVITMPAVSGPSVIPPGSSVLPAGNNAAIATAADGSQLGWVRVSGGWILASRSPSGQVTPLVGAVVVPYPGAQNPTNSPTLPADAAAYFASTVGGTPAAPASEYPNLTPGGSLPGLRVPQPASGLLPPGSTAPGTAFSPQPILPNSVLPPALQRGNPLLRQTTYYPNRWDARLLRSSAFWTWARDHGGLQSCCRVPALGAPIYNEPPWMVMPSQGEKFEKPFALPTLSVSNGNVAFDGTDTVLGQFVVPNGYDGAINRFICGFTGDGYQDFTGAIVWRLLINNRFARNLGNVKNMFGSFQNPFSVPGIDNIRLVSQQTVTLIASIPVNSPVSGGYVSAGAFGWFYPRR